MTDRPQAQVPNVHELQNGFAHLDAPLDGLVHVYDLGWKFNLDTNGPPGRPGDPYLLLYVSFAATSGALRGSGTLHYALNRSRWSDMSRITDDDRVLLLQLASERVRRDLASLEVGNDLPWLSENKHLYLVPGPHRG
jgi:hypothetical protein